VAEILSLSFFAKRPDSGNSEDHGREKRLRGGHTAEWLTGGPPREAEVSPKSAAQAETHPQMGRRSESESTWAARAYQ